MPHRVATADEDLTVNFYHGVPFKHNSRTLKHSRYPNVLRYAPDGSVFATCGSDAKVFLYDGKTGEMVKELVAEDGHTGSIFGLAWSPDSKELVTASADKTVKVWNVEQGNVAHTWQVASGTGEWDDQQACVMWGASGQIVSVSISGALNFWSRDSVEPTRVQVGHLEPIGAFTLSHATATAFSGDMAGRICKWNANTGAVEWFTGSGHGVKPISALAVSCDGDKLYSAGLDNTVISSDAKAGKFGQTVGVVANQVKSMAAGKKDNDLAAFVTVKGQVGLIRGGKIVNTAEVKDASQIVFSGDDKQVYVAGASAKVMFVFNVDGDKLVSAPASADEFQQPCLALDSSDKFVASTQHNEINVWNEDFTQSRSYGWAYHTLRITSMKWSPSGKFLATGGSDKQIIIWRDFEKFKPRPVVLPEVHTLGVTDFDWVDEKSLVVVGDDGCIKKLNVVAEL
jgi:WD40 repeat protein